MVRWSVYMYMYIILTILLILMSSDVHCNHQPQMQPPTQPPQPLPQLQHHNGSHISSISIDMGGMFTDCWQLAGCKACTPAVTECELCQKRFALSTNRQQCRFCGSHCVSCIVEQSYNTSDDVIVCTQCEHAHYIYVTSNATLCKRCPAHCDSCSSHTSCDHCITGYRSTGAVVQCPACPPNCLRCHSDDQCIICAERYYLHHGFCHACGPSCTECVGLNDCLRCDEGTMWVDGGCTECVLPECSLCVPNEVSASSSALIPTAATTHSGGQLCLRCTPGYYLDAQHMPTCQQCSPHCANCNNRGQCFDCDAGYYLSPLTSQCTKCMTSCDYCRSGRDCMNCSIGHYWNGFACIRCRVAFCDVCYDDSLLCLDCVRGHYFDDESSTCKGCYSAISSCLDCSSRSMCTECMDNLYFDPVHVQCLRCGSDCTQCVYNSDTGGSTCVQCRHGYCWDPRLQLCREWLYSSPCRECTDYTDGLSCLDCLVEVPGRYLKVCEACEVSYCKRCDSHRAECDECIEGRIYNEQQRNCQECPGWPNCKSCNTTDVCDSCNVGYFGAFCQACPPNCISCTSTTTCDQCAAGNYYWHEANTRCNKCGANCVLCSTSTYCTQCADRSIRNINNPIHCTVCPDGCEWCEWSNNRQHTVCSMCQVGYYLTQYSTCRLCKQSLDRCAVCEDRDQDGQISPPECLDCSPGFFSEDSSQCLACSIPGCQQCTRRQPSCLQCIDMYDLTGSQCLLRGEECYKYECSGDDCEEPYEWSGVELCPRMGLSQACWTMRTERPNGRITYSRGCKNTTCNASNRAETCDIIHNNKVCGVCCDHHKCNIHHLSHVQAMLVNQANTIHQHQYHQHHQLLHHHHHHHYQCQYHQSYNQQHQHWYHDFPHHHHHHQNCHHQNYYHYHSFYYCYHHYYLLYTKIIVYFIVYKLWQSIWYFTTIT